jgi:uncharacterized protein
MTGPVFTTQKTKLPSIPIGWPLLPVPDSSGQLRWPDAARSVRELIEVILRTIAGEQLMHPGFGAGLETLIHQPNNLTVRAQTQDVITAALKRYEDRIIVDQVDVDSGADPRELNVTIAYRIRLTGSADQISARVPVGGA